MITRDKIVQVARFQGQLLREKRCGHPEWYAEMLVAAAYDGQLMPTNFPKYDMDTPNFGRVQVKSRVDGTDTNQNRSNFGKYSLGDFDNAVIVLFSANYEILGAARLQCEDVLSLVRPAGHVKWADAAEHANAVDVTGDLKLVSQE